MRPRPHLPFLLAFLSLLASTPPSPLRAQSVTIYRCTDAAGTLTMQNAPCPAGSSQSERQVADVASSPEEAAQQPVPPPAAEPAARATQARGTGDAGGADAAVVQYSADGSTITTGTGPEPRILDSATLPRTAQAVAAPEPGAPPPPPIYRCTTYDNDSYLSEAAEAPPRCLPLRTVGLDGDPAGGAGRACEVVRDRCVRVPEDGACDAWARHVREAEKRWRFAHPDNVERRRGEYERLAAIIAGSCGAR